MNYVHIYLLSQFSDNMPLSLSNIYIIQTKYTVSCIYIYLLDIEPCLYLFYDIQCIFSIRQSACD